MASGDKEGKSCFRYHIKRVRGQNVSFSVPHFISWFHFFVSAFEKIIQMKILRFVLCSQFAVKLGTGPSCPVLSSEHFPQLVRLFQGTLSITYGLQNTFFASAVAKHFLLRGSINSIFLEMVERKKGAVKFF